MRHHLALIVALTLLAGLVAPAIALAWPDGTRVPLDAPAQNRDAPASACSAVITETVGFDPLRVCDEQPVTVTLALTCPTRLPQHVVFIIGNHLAMQDHLDDVKQAARNAVNAMSWAPGTMAGVVTISTEAKKELDLTASKGAVLAAIGRIQLDPIDPFQDYYDWVGSARQMLEQARDEAVSPLEAIVVYTTGCPTGFESYCSRQVAATNKAKGVGMTVLAVCNPNARPFGFPLPAGHCKTLQQVASPRYYHDLQQAGRVGDDLVSLEGQGQSLDLATVTLLEVLAPEPRLVAGSAGPPPKIQGQRLTFTWEDVPPGGLVTATYRVRAPAVGQTALRTAASVVNLVDNLDRGAGPLPVALRTLNVVPCDAPTPTATATCLVDPGTATPIPTATATTTPTSLPTATPTDTDTPAPTDTPTATPTATPRPARLALPVLLHHACRQAVAAADIVLAIDASSSMDELSAGRLKIQSAREAAARFVELLATGRDRAAVVAFNRDAILVQGLTADRAALATAIAGITTQPGTRIDRALAMAAAELLGPDARADSTRVIVLLTDGLTEEGSAATALANAAAARGRGILVYTIGLGDTVDAGFLRQVASGAGNYFPAPTAADLTAIYEGIARDLPCPGGAVIERPVAGP